MDDQTDIIEATPSDRAAEAFEALSREVLAEVFRLDATWVETGPGGWLLASTRASASDRLS